MSIFVLCIISEESDWRAKHILKAKSATCEVLHVYLKSPTSYYIKAVKLVGTWAASKKIELLS